MSYLLDCVVEYQDTSYAIYMAANSHGVSPKKIRTRPHKTAKRLAIKAARLAAQGKKTAKKR